MKITKVLVVVLVSALTSLGVAKVMGEQGNTNQAAPKETAFTRVTATNKIKCAYLVAAPQLTRDPNTGELSGLSYDIMVEAAKRLNLTVEWTEEVSFATFAEGLKTGRYDAFCFTAYRWSPWARIVDYARPVYFSTTDVYVREDDTRFDGNLAAINDPAVTVATIDSSGGHFLRNEQFPQSKNYSMVADTNLSLVLESLATNKADVTISNPLVAMPYLVANPGKVRRVRNVPSLRAYGHAFSFAKGEQDLRNMFDVVFDEMLTDGTIDKILDKYESIPNSFIRIKSPVAPAPEKESP